MIEMLYCTGCLVLPWSHLWLFAPRLQSCSKYRHLLRALYIFSTLHFGHSGPLSDKSPRKGCHRCQIIIDTFYAFSQSIIATAILYRNHYFEVGRYGDAGTVDVEDVTGQSVLNYQPGPSP